MPIYGHQCRECDCEWSDEYSLVIYDQMKAEGKNVPCPNCDSEDTYRQLGVLPIHFKGAGWSPDGYYKYHAYDQHQKEGKKVEIYENKHDMMRVMKGERRQAFMRRLKREHEAAKRHLGPDAGLTEAEADRRMDKELKTVKPPPEHK